MEKKELEFVRFTHAAMFSMIPPELFEQLPDDTLIVENAYRYGPRMISLPETYFYACIDPDIQKVVGFIWCYRDMLTNQLNATYCSALKEYQRQGIIEKFFLLMKQVIDENKMSPTLIWFSLFPKTTEAYGGKKSKCTAYEFNTGDPEYGVRRRKESEA